MGGCRRVALVLGVLWGVIGLYICARSGFSAFRSLQLVRHGEVGSATVVAYHRVSDSPYPVLSFVGPDGNEVRFTSTLGPRVGDVVQVRFDPANPANVKVDSFRGLWTSALVGSAVGVGLFVVPGALAYWFLRWRPIGSGTRVVTKY